MTLTPEYRAAVRRVGKLRRELDVAERDAMRIWMEEQG